jgi:hypothetical protein
MTKQFKQLSTISLLSASLFFSGCGSEKQPNFADGVKSSFKISNGMSIEEVEKLMQVEPTGKEKIDDTVIYRYEGNTQSGKDETFKQHYNNIIVKFKDGKVIKSGIFSCNIPKAKEE